MEQHYLGFEKGFVVRLMTGAVGAALVYEKRKKTYNKLWKLKAKAEIYRKLKDLKLFTKDTYEDLVETVLAKYEVIQDNATNELEEMEDALKSEWEEVKDRFAERKEKID